MDPKALIFVTVICCLGSGSLAASLKAGGITSAERQPAVVRVGHMTLVSGPAPAIHTGGLTTVFDNYNSRSVGGSSVVGGDSGPIFHDDGGEIFVDQWSTAKRRKLMSADATAAQKASDAQKAADARIITKGGRTAAFAYDGTPWVHTGGSAEISGSRSRMWDGRTDTVDDYGQPVVNEYGYVELSPWRRRSLLAPIKAVGGTTIVGGATPTIVSATPPTDAAAAAATVNAAMTSHSQIMAEGAQAVAQSRATIGPTTAAASGKAAPSAVVPPPKDSAGQKAQVPLFDQMMAGHPGAMAAHAQMVGGSPFAKGTGAAVVNARASGVGCTRLPAAAAGPPAAAKAKVVKAGEVKVIKAGEVLIGRSVGGISTAGASSVPEGGGARTSPCSDTTAAPSGAPPAPVVDTTPPTMPANAVVVPPGTQLRTKDSFGQAVVVEGGVVGVQ